MSNLLNTKKAAENLGVSVRRVQALINNGQLKAEKFGRDFMIKESDLPKLKKLKRGRPVKTAKK
jgi:excisionase family DNA binding protein